MATPAAPSPIHLRWFSIAFLASCIVLIPCFWQPHIQSVDLPSHLYNAWLYNQAVAGNLPGLVIANQTTNVLVDILLAPALRYAGPTWAERFLAGLSVLVFFWGAFRFITVFAHGPPWYLTPLLAMLAYGVIFRWGLFNFYLSLGLCLWAASLVWARRWLDWVWALLLFVAAVVAHPMPAGWIAAIVIYLKLVPRLRVPQRTWLFAGSVLALVIAHVLLKRLVVCAWPDLSPKHARTYAGFVGLAQLVPYGMKYWAVAGSVLLLWLPRLLRDVPRWSGRFFTDDGMAQLAVLQVIGSLLSPDGIVKIPGYRLGLYLVDERLSLLTAIILCVLLARIAPSLLRSVALTLIAMAYFSFAYADERAINQVEDRVLALVETLPRGQRLVIALREEPPVGIPKLLHILDRPCIGRCFDYGNFEPPTDAFRLRADQPNAYVMSDIDDPAALQTNGYTVKSTDPPLYLVDFCDRSTLQFCATALRPGQTTKTDDITVEPSLWRAPLEQTRHR